MPETRLVADIGGTNTRIGRYSEASGEISEIRSFANADFESLEAAIEHWLAGASGTPPRRACIAVAAPPAEDLVSMVNIGWRFSCRELAQRFGFTAFAWVNDFEANAYALPHLQASELVTLQQAQVAGDSTLAVIGPGTGLGGATLRRHGGSQLACGSEPGHAGITPGNELELDLFRDLLREHGSLYAELILSGAGLPRLYAALARLGGRPPEDLGPAEVSARGLAGSDPDCRQALATFCGLLGSVSGDYVLANGAYGGIYITGGIVPRMIDFLRDSDFLARFQAKGAMRQQMSAVPVQIVTAAQTGLLGAAHAPLAAT